MRGKRTLTITTWLFLACFVAVPGRGQDSSDEPATEIPELAGSEFPTPLPSHEPSDNPVQVASEQPVASDDSTPAESTHEKYVSAFDGDISVLLTGELPQGAIQVPVRTRNGYSNVTTTTMMSLVPRSQDLTPEQRLGIAVFLQEQAIRGEQQKMMRAKTPKERETCLASLREMYAKRFAIDTAYQDFKVREIERRAKKLRDEVTKREAASQEWVDAMVTLSKMSASGIETMNPHPPASLVPVAGFSQPVGAGAVMPPPIRPTLGFGNANPPIGTSLGAPAFTGNPLNELSPSSTESFQASGARNPATTNSRRSFDSNQPGGFSSPSQNSPFTEPAQPLLDAAVPALRAE